VTFSGCVTRMLMSRWLSAGSGRPVRWVIIATSLHGLRRYSHSLLGFGSGEKPRPAHYCTPRGPAVSHSYVTLPPSPEEFMMAEIEPTRITYHGGTVTAAERRKLLKQKGCTLWF